MGFEGGGVGGCKPKSNISRFPEVQACLHYPIRMAARVLVKLIFTFSCTGHFVDTGIDSV